jgi:hypothetical protein
MDYLNTIHNEDGTYYWQSNLPRYVSLIVPKQKNNLELSQYVLGLETLP